MNIMGLEYLGNSDKVQQAIIESENVAVSKAQVLIIGESGTGKKSLAKLIHDRSTRAENNLLYVDCSESHKVVENKILGHRDPESGKFIKGVLENGNKGTVVFLNIEYFNEKFQKKIVQIFKDLLDYDLDVRIIATTSKNLSKLVGVGKFTRELYNFFSTTQVYLPPLRDRKDDIDYLINLNLNSFCSEKSLEIPTISLKAIDKLRNHFWSSNSLELKNVIENTLTQVKDNIIDIDDLIIGERKSSNYIEEEDGLDDDIKLMSLKEAEKLLIKKALIHTSENRTQAAKILGVSIRTLRNKINEYRSDGSNYFLNLR